MIRIFLDQCEFAEGLAESAFPGWSVVCLQSAALWAPHVTLTPPALCDIFAKVGDKMRWRR